MTDPVTQEVYQFLATYIQQHGFSPSIREIAQGCYLGRSTAMRHLAILEARGLIRREPGKSRSIVLAQVETEPS